MGQVMETKVTEAFVFSVSLAVHRVIFNRKATSEGQIVPTV